MCLTEMVFVYVTWRRAQSASVSEASLIPLGRLWILSNDSCVTEGKVFTTGELLLGSVLFCGVKVDLVNARVPTYPWETSGIPILSKVNSR